MKNFLDPEVDIHKFFKYLLHIGSISTIFVYISIKLYKNLIQHSYPPEWYTIGISLAFGLVIANVAITFLKEYGKLKPDPKTKKE